MWQELKAAQNPGNHPEEDEFHTLTYLGGTEAAWLDFPGV